MILWWPFILSKLHDEDPVFVIADTCRGKDGLTEEFNSHADFDWFNHVTTRKAKETLINYFSGKYKLWFEFYVNAILQLYIPKTINST